MNKIEELKKKIILTIKRGRINLLNMDPKFHSSTFDLIAHDIVEDFISDSIGINEQLRNENLVLQNTIEQYKEIIKKFNNTVGEIN